MPLVRVTARIVGLATVCLTVYVASLLAIYRALLLFRLSPPWVRTEDLPLIVPLFMCVPVFLAYWCGRLLARRWGLDRAFASSATLRVLGRTAVVCYVLTSFVGIPQVLSEQRTWLIQGYLRSFPEEQIKDDWPVVNRSWAAVPLLPFVVVNYHEYVHVAVPMTDFRGIEVSAWYVTGVRSVARIPVRRLIRFQ